MALAAVVSLQSRRRVKVLTACAAVELTAVAGCVPAAVATARSLQKEDFKQVSDPNMCEHNQFCSRAGLANPAHTLPPAAPAKYLT